jgi:predicted RNA-binding Zn-ribbon protein involved in translation (DUF1610 family)
MNDKDSVGIIIKESSNGPYYCNTDNTKLHLQNKETREYICPKCGDSYFPSFQQVKKGNKFETPYGKDHMPLLSLVNDSNTQPSSVYHKPKIAASIQQMLNRPGVKLLDYTTSED